MRLNAGWACRWCRTAEANQEKSIWLHPLPCASFIAPRLSSSSGRYRRVEAGCSEVDQVRHLLAERHGDVMRGLGHRALCGRDTDTRTRTRRRKVKHARSDMGTGKSDEPTSCNSPRPHAPEDALSEWAGWSPACVSARLCLTQSTVVGLVRDQRARSLLKRLPALRVLLHARQGLGQLSRHRQFLWGKRAQQRTG